METRTKILDNTKKQNHGSSATLISKEYELFVGSFGTKTNPIGFNLYKLDEFYKHFYRNVILKSNEKLFRFDSDRIRKVGGEQPLIKINLQKKLAYFLSENDKATHQPIFHNLGYKLTYLNLFNDNKKLALGGEIENNLSEAINKAYQIGKKSYPKAQVPAQNKELMELMSSLNLQIGEGIPLMKSFNKARFDENEKEMIKKFPELYQNKIVKLKSGGEIDYLKKYQKPKQTAFNFVYNRLLKVAPNLLNYLKKAKYVSDVYGKSQYRTQDFGGNDSYMALYVEALEKDNKGRYIISISHYYKQQGDMMCDPCMTVRLDAELKTVEALTFKMDGIIGRGIIKEVYGKMTNGNIGINLYEKKAQNSFLNTWSSNWVNQGHKVKLDELEETIEVAQIENKLVKLQKDVIELLNFLNKEKDQKVRADQWNGENDNENIASRSRYFNNFDTLWQIAIKYGKPIIKVKSYGTEDKILFSGDDLLRAIKQYAKAKGLKIEVPILNQKQETETHQIENEEAVKFFKKDFSTLLSLALEKENNIVSGWDINLFKSSFFNKLKTKQKNGNQELVNDVLKLVQIAQNKLKKPIYTNNHKIWKLGTSTISLEAKEVLKTEFNQMKEFLKPDDKNETGMYFYGIDYEYKNQFFINKAIEEFLNSKSNDYIFSNEEKTFIYKYEGYGGLEKQGATGKGLLWEYYTPELLNKKMWALAYKYGFQTGKVLEPSVGVGRVLDFAAPQDNITAYEINHYSARICKIIHQNVTVNIQSFEEHFYNGNVYNPNFDNTYDLVIGNPPYGKNVGKRSVAEQKRLKASVNQFEHYFILRGLDTLKSGGLLIYISTANLFTKGYEKVKERIMEKAELVDAYLLPNTTFKRTSINTSLIVLKRR